MEDQPALRDDFNGIFRFCGVERVAKKDFVGATTIGNDGLSTEASATVGGDSPLGQNTAVVELSIVEVDAGDFG